MSAQEIVMNVHTSNVWELLDLFKERCKLKGWKTSECEDWVKIGDDE